MITVASDDLEGLATYFRTAADAAVPAMRMAINDVATRGGMALIREEMTDQIAFPRGYLTGDRIGVTKRATNASLEAVITGRKRATSLARFTSARTINQKGGVSVRVSRGRTTYLKQAWLVRLKKGASLDEDNYNIGLAVRLRPGEKGRRFGVAAPRGLPRARAGRHVPTATGWDCGRPGTSGHHAGPIDVRRLRPCQTWRQRSGFFS